MRSGLLGQMNNPSTNGVNGHLPGDALAAGRLPGKRSSTFFLTILILCIVRVITNVSQQWEMRIKRMKIMANVVPSSEGPVNKVIFC